jgi:phospholipid transport system substrate-binding protein
MKISFVFTLFFLLFTVPIPPCTAEEAPSGAAVDVIKLLNTTLTDCMKRGSELGYAGRYGLLEPVMQQAFFFTYMVRKSCGSSWDALDADQQKQLLQKYITWSVGTYAERFKNYKGQQFVIVAAQPVRKKYMKVTSHMINAEKKVREFIYFLLQDKGNWRIVDIQIEGVSQLSMTRSQFKSVLNDQGSEGLLNILNEKIDQLNTDD